MDYIVKKYLDTLQEDRLLIYQFWGAKYNIMNIQYGCVLLRPIEMNDSELLQKLMNDPVVERTIVGLNFSVSKTNQEEWMRSYYNSDKQLRFMIELSNETVLGMITLTNIDWINRCASINIKTNPTETKRIKGDVKDAMYAICSYAFDTLNLERIESSTLDFNVFSLKLTRGLGFIDEGLLRHKAFKNGQWHNLILGALLRDEFQRYDDGEAPWQKKRKENA